jgi:hypothetical protein
MLPPKQLKLKPWSSSWEGLEIQESKVMGFSNRGLL